MRKTLCLAFALSLLIGCHQPHGVTVVTEFPQEGPLTATTVSVPVPFLSPMAMLAFNDHLVVYKNREEFLFSFYSLPAANYLFSAGMMGQGPNDFLLLDPRSLHPTDSGFCALETMTNRVDTISVQDNRLVVSKTKPLFRHPANNGFYPLNDSIVLLYGTVDAKKEYTLYNKRTSEMIPTGEYPHWTTKEPQSLQQFMTYIKSSVVHPLGNRFASFYGRFKRFRIYDASGTILHDVQVHIGKYDAPETASPTYYIGQPQAVGKYIYVLCANTVGAATEKTSAYELQVWDWNGAPIACYTLDKNLSMFSISEKYRKLYALIRTNADELFIYDLPSLP
jgi:hypothetical protein